VYTGRAPKIARGKRPQIIDNYIFRVTEILSLSLQSSAHPALRLTLSPQERECVKKFSFCSLFGKEEAKGVDVSLAGRLPWSPP
jgi:hypothetical protein